MTNSSHTSLLSSDGPKTWHLSIVPEQYDRSPLTSEEKRALGRAVRYLDYAWGNNGSQYAQEELMRFQQPIYDVVALRSQAWPTYLKVRRVLYLQMFLHNTSFWEWSKEVWIAVIHPNSQDFQQKYGKDGVGRISLMDMAYLLGGITDLREIGQRRDCLGTTRLYFGATVVDHEIRRVTDLLVGREGQGYAADQKAVRALTQTFSLLFLLNRCPLLESISPELLQGANQGPDALGPFQVEKTTSVLHQLGLLDSLPERRLVAQLPIGDTAGVPEEWVAWCRAWLKRYPKISKRLRNFTNLLMVVGRWLADRHPGIVSPRQWDEELAIEYVNYLCSTATVGEYAAPTARKVLIKRKVLGKPLAPRTIKQKLAAMVCFFTDLQKKAHEVHDGGTSKIEQRFNPREIFAVPSSIKKLIQPDPRDIDEIIWCKLTYAAATLTEEDYSVSLSGYPLAYYRAAALLLVTSARRPNEIMRLQMGCIRRDWDPAMLGEDGLPLPGQEAQLCYLLVPASKTKGPYWVPIPKYAADAVETWERDRPFSQPKRVDRKDDALVDFLFCLRGVRMGQKFLNHSLIPVLCRRAGVPEHDARGTITGHRARSTIATMLRRNGLSLDDIAEFLGHANANMVRSYARTDPYRFGRDMNRANDLMRIVEGVIDTRAARNGKPNVFFFLGRGRDGLPRFCGNPAWEKGPHRLACLKCPMYVGGGQASRLTERLEARDEIFKFQMRVEMTPQEKAATEGDIETLTELITAESDTPPPELPSEDFRFNTQTSQENGLSPSPESQGDLLALGRELVELNRALTLAEQRTDGRNASIRSLKKRIATVTEQMAALEQISTLTTSTLGM